MAQQSQSANNLTLQQNKQIFNFLQHMADKNLLSFAILPSCFAISFSSISLHCLSNPRFKYKYQIKTSVAKKYVNMTSILHRKV
jgi:hypothetical protein